MEIKRNFYSLDGKLYGCYKLVKNETKLFDSYFSYLEGEYCWEFLHNESEGEAIYTSRPNHFYIKFELEDLDGD